MKKYAALVLGLVLMASPALAAPATGTPIKIGDINAYGKLSVFVQPYKNGIEMAVDEINAAGGINGHPLQIVSRDSKFDPATSVTMADDLLMREKVSVIMNCDSSTATLAVASWAKRNKIPFVNTASEADSTIWEQGNDYSFRLSQGGYMWLSAVMNEAIKLYGDKLKGKRWAIVAPNFEFGQSLVKMAKMITEERGLNPTWVIEQWPAYDKLETGATVAALERSKPDIILNILITNDLAKFVREGNKRGLFKNRIIIAPQTAMPDHLDMLGKETPAGWISAGFPVDDIQDKVFAKFRKAYADKYHTPLKSYSLSGYNGVQAIAAALRKAGSEDPAKIRDALETVSFSTPFGEQQFRKIDHQANVPFWVGVTGVKGGKGKLLDWTMEKAEDHSPPDAWILEQRAKAADTK
ncbi:MAG: ABC transporter substrate-binding protein [Alphaproteobacteria bacterium]|nr:ABC transporter substrate-binding protein [Alphaproteobacteria bacterium]